VKNIWKIDGRKHTISIVRLVSEINCNSLRAYPATLIRSLAPEDVQYHDAKQQMLDICSAIARWASAFGISSVGGPILSGAVLAAAIAAQSKTLSSFYVAKKAGYYKPSRHCLQRVKGICRGKYVLIDDIISSGDSMELALKNIEQDNGNLEGLEAIINLGGEFCITTKPHRLLTGLIEEGKVFGLYCSKRR
jgi:adenine/guanine phosphoribosyltransferase-like PRPP-binding protein